MSHPNAALTPRHRLKVARLVVDDGWPISEVAARFQVSWPTVKRRDALETWLHHYNQHRPHTACGNQPPFSRLTNVSDQYN